MQNPVLFGLFGFMHGGAKTLAVMSADDCTQVLRQWQQHPRLVVLYNPGSLIILQEKTTGTLKEIIQAFSITIVDKPGWDLQKIELGASIYCLGHASGAVTGGLQNVKSADS